MDSRVRQRGGRPSREAAALLHGAILDAASALFLSRGFAATSMEAVAAAARVSKRTLYARHAGKAALLLAVVSRLVARWFAPYDAALARDLPLEEGLRFAAAGMLAAALTPEALSLHRLVLAEAGRFPEICQVLAKSGAGIGIAHLAELLGRAGIADPVWRAEQFMHLVLTGPQRRALGLGAPLDAAGLEDWAQRAVALFLRGAEAA
jgi:TetR/AcrR family transcriptional regulator, mexJK operon transcriptional repressor